MQASIVTVTFIIITSSYVTYTPLPGGSVPLSPDHGLLQFKVIHGLVSGEHG